MDLHITGVTGLPDIREGDDLAALIRAAAPSITARSIVVVAQKIVSKAEGALIDLAAVEPSPFAREWAAKWGRDARLIELVLRESRRIVKMDRGVIIAETQHGLVAANAGVDESNVQDGYATVLPRDPDGSARALRDGLGAGAVLISDTFGRPWREGLVNVAIGAAGLAPLEDLRGTADRYGRRLHSTVLAFADELAAAAGLVMRKAAGVPAAVIEGCAFAASEAGARALVRPPERDLFR
jgi:coenzyme F420-0:L-glutamate ligase/coenzyme F420-1:gamma-L-glutamate ligase